ncbi:MAG: PilT/PilU family type 4a pilus ATPase [Candidatus Omnitrophica bacterium]|nr:PilT/PilU family type 4a pilus ATPase [Candidatus Omnitrophota bacterium]MDD5042212.1 PilT/PilU family type 4a pilus ATPase [Candidatus Omnitrophota bacterium]MDD5500067.1 PilT/PilU family type 4a pilus ATPase [Candidatus Omnitrophota bacterium]
MDIKKLMQEMVSKGGSDLFYRAGGMPRMRIDGKIISMGEQVLSVEDVLLATQQLANFKQLDIFRNNMDVDFAVYLEEFGRRFRVSIFMQRNWPSIVIRNVRNNISTFEELSLPVEIFKKLSLETRGLVLLTGSMGSGKSTTIASMIEYINNNAKKHILTAEEPIEFTFEDKQSIINQRELGIDVSSYAVALRSFTLQSPDVMFIGNICDYETVSSAITAAETGVLVLSTLHTINASQSVERLINFFPPHQHQEARNQLATLLKGIISLRLVPAKDGSGRIPAYEVMLLTPTISRLIREGKIWEIPQFIDDGAVFGMQSFNQSLVKLVQEGKISEEDAASAADNRDEFMLAFRGIKK